jgi:hypothetical protein
MPFLAALSVASNRQHLANIVNILPRLALPHCTNQRATEHQWQRTDFAKKE